MSTKKEEMKEGGNEGFLKRWSRVKTEALQATPSSPAAEATAPPKKASDEPAPVLPPVENLTLESDFSGFFHPKVDENLRRSALRKLFSDPHFNVMDGLDVYIDDYSKSEPIPAAMLASLKQAQRILEWAADKGEEGGQPHESADATSDERAEEMPEQNTPAAAIESSLVQPQPAASESVLVRPGRTT